MQKAPVMEWSKPKVMGDLPPRMSGHSFTIIKNQGYMFGGSQHKKPPGPTDELYKLDMSTDEFYWTKTACSESPAARWHHSANTFNGTSIVVFGGFSASKTNRYFDDVWVLDTTNDTWWRPDPATRKPWNNCPVSRGAHSATVVGSSLYVFGGYGGTGYSRRDFNDMTALDLDTWEWNPVETTGEQPEPRSGHQTVATTDAGADKLYVSGGWNANAQFDDVFVLDLASKAWSRLAEASGEAWGPPRWNFTAIAAFAVPHMKIFAFGGNSGSLEDGAPQGTYRADMCLLDTGTNTWSSPECVGEFPTPRADTQMVYDAANGQVVLFGGWSNSWHDDLYVCKISEVVGPPYSVFELAPAIGPITGNTPMSISGLGFEAIGQNAVVTVRYACPKGFYEVDGTVVSDTEVTFETPNFLKFGAVDVECRVAIGGKALTNSAVHFSYFAVTDASRSLAFGPGLLNGGLAGMPISFIIQAKDKAALNRVCGMDEFSVTVSSVEGPDADADAGAAPEEGDAEEDADDERILVQVEDNGNGTYLVTYVPPSAGEYTIEVDFVGTFEGAAGPVRGSPFAMTCRPNEPIDDEEDVPDPKLNDLDGPVLVETMRKEIADLKEFSLSKLRGLQADVPKEDLNALISVKEHLKIIEERRVKIELMIDTFTATLDYMKAPHSPFVDRMVADLGSADEAWRDVLKQAPETARAMMPLTKLWSANTSDSIDEYERMVRQTWIINSMMESHFKSCTFWDVSTGPEEARLSLTKTQNEIGVEETNMIGKEHLCTIFGFPEKMDVSRDLLNKVKQNLSQMRTLWDVAENLDSFIAQSRSILWRDIQPDQIDEDTKAQMKAVKGLHKEVRWCDAFKKTDKLCKDFQNTIPLIGLLGSKAMRPRHWTMLKVATKKDFTPPYEDADMQLGQLLSLNLHEFSADVEEICDQAVKEEKMENTLAQLADRWEAIEFLADTYKDTEVPLLKVQEEDYEALEADQLTVQGMMASRFLAQFEAQVTMWQKSLANVSDVYTLIQEIQRTWSYLEPLFIGSDEVKRELPEDAERFAGIDSEVKDALKASWKTKLIKEACNAPGLLTSLTEMVAGLDLCKKSLTDFLDGRRRQFPRYYFVSEADLLDILSNGSSPEKILVHTPKVYLASKTLVLGEEKTASGRPICCSWVAGVGVEETEFEPPVPLEGKVEIYMQTLLDAMKSALYSNLKRSLVRYDKLPRTSWLMAKKEKPFGGSGDSAIGKPADPAQISLLTLAVNYVAECEQAFEKLSAGNPAALAEFNEKQIEQLNGLIGLTQTKLTKGDRTRVMVCITMDAHGRDVVKRMVMEKVDAVTCFQWQSQLKHKYRVPPAKASFINRDQHLRSESGQRAEIAIADAIVPYDYEYLGNGARLVITPLTDRIYVTATQALNLKMGCAPAGPAGTGKTESTKDLACALAKCCYVVNCSPEMDYQGLGNIFKGVASSGSWICFDEFNRLIPEVLSVCTVQFKSVCDGCKAESSRITVEGDEVTLDPTCGAFITMNPGYLGRSELPEGLKALFRPMTVMVPDLVLICENMLMSEGFNTAKILASKFFGLYSLLKDLLSKQMHYDWGLRAVKSVLVVAGSFKRAEPDLPEDQLLMRALRDMNVPKIIAEDAVVFFPLLKDMFPGIDPPRKVDPDLEGRVLKGCHNLGLDPDEVFRLKCVQLDELLAIRHCVFIMGPPGAGKSESWRVLKEAREIGGIKVKISDVSPKAVSCAELYGFISMATREWKDGLLSKIMRDLGQIDDEDPKWIMLDGDLDANWIESMNSVMDDNRMLTLASNERIPLKAHMRMIFEIRDLKHATPATVSRAGVVYISTDEGSQWRSLVTSWLAKYEGTEEIKDAFRTYFDKYLNETLLWNRIHLKPVVALEDTSYVQSLLYMLDGALNEVNTATPEALEIVFVFCTVWALGCGLTLADDGTDYRKMFSDHWRTTWKDVKFPSRETVFDYWLDPAVNAFEQWSKSEFFFAVDFDSRTTPMAQVTVPTSETCSVTFWMESLVNMRRPVMMCGPAGTGKTQMVTGLLKTRDQTKLMHAVVNFNFYTGANVLCNTMGLPLEKKVGTNFGPPGTAKLVYFIDDINLPALDNYNTQSAIELLRQHVEYEHQYDLSKLASNPLKSIANTQLVACMNPTAGSFVVNPRLQRWFTTFAVGLPGPTSLLTIYQTFLDGHLKPFADEVKALSSNLIKAALGLHASVVQNFRKTAKNFHYEFNIRHLANVFQGLLVAQPDEFSNGEKFVQLWLHESERIYGDRLVSAEDLTKYNQLVQVQAKKLFSQFSVSKFYANERSEPLIFCHFADNITDKCYDQVTSMESMSDVLEDALHEYNESNAEMNLVLFDDAMKHVARVVRIVLNEGGHALLVGVGGSGKQSLSRLAAYICEYTVVQIVISSTYGVNDLKDDLKAMYNKAGVKEEGVMFLLTDSQITNEKFLIFINDLLASGNIPDLFAVDEVDAIVNGVTKRVKAAGLVPDRKICWDFFIGEIRKNLHVCLCFSPVGDDFRIRSRKFPALVNCTVIDFFQPWPKDALFDVGCRFLNEIEDLGEPKVRQAVEKFLPFSVEAVTAASAKFQAVERRFVYTTPKSYLELLKLYFLLLGEKREDADSSIERLETGLKKLSETASAVGELSENLKVALAEADIKKRTSEGIAEVVSKEKAIVEVETAKAEEEAKAVSKIQAEVSVKARDTEADLAKAEPAVEAAMAALAGLDPKDISAAKSMGTPPPGVSEVFEATMVLLGGIVPAIKCDKKGKPTDLKGGPGTGWGAAKKVLMGDIKGYIQWLMSLKDVIDNNSINAKNFVNVRQYLELESFKPEIIMTKNSAAAGLCGFIINIVIYYDIVTQVEPKRKALAEANATLESANARLEVVNTQVAELQAKLAVLMAQLQEANDAKQEAIDTVEKGTLKLSLAQRLTGALSSENERWGINVVQLKEDKQLLTGDVLLASAFISYVGPFTKPFRNELMNDKFLPFLRKEFEAAVGEGGLVPMSAAPTPVDILATAAEVAGWQGDGLPADQVSTENGTIVSNTARWPLLIDPQLQGIRWVKQKESSNGRSLDVVRLGQKDMLRKLEAALSAGTSVLIENLGETLEAVLSPVIQRAKVKKGRAYYVKIGDSEVEFNEDFRLFLHTKLGNPHYPPEIQAETTLVNFTVTTLGLEDQMLTLVVGKERPDLAKLADDLVGQQNQYKIQMKELEDNILFKLATAEGDITEDVALIEGLEKSKVVSSEIAEKAEMARNTQASIKVTSEKYRPVANRTSLLFFLMNDLVKMHSYYIYSLAAFTKVFYRGIDAVTEKKEADAADPNAADDAAAADDATAASTIADAPTLSNAEFAARCTTLIDSITETTFAYIRRGLFECDKLTVAALLAIKILVNDGKLLSEDVDLLIGGKQSSDPGNMGPLHEWLPETIWPKVKALESSKRFHGLGDAMQSDSDDWLAWFDDEKAEQAKLPGDYEKSLQPFDRLILLRAMRPDRVTTALSKYVADTMGPQYVSQAPFSMPATYEETSSQTPVFFVLFPGVDPTAWVEDLGKELGISYEYGTFRNISMGQGQEKPAEAIVERFARAGGWVMLQNLHLMQSWLPTLERLLEVVQENAHENFRCFISAEPPNKIIKGSKNMPESLLQSCVKVANEAPADIKSNLNRAWTNFSQDRVDQSSKGEDFKACLFSLCWFHAIVLGRRRFGTQGWSRAYSFNTGDLTICANVLFAYLEDNPTVPWQDLRYIFGEIMYGGHITDFWDRRTCNVYLTELFNEKLLSGLELAPAFPSPDPTTMDYGKYFEYIESKLPAESPPQFGLHPNAEIGYLTSSTGLLFETIVAIESGGGGGGGGGSDVAKSTMLDLMERLPTNFEMIGLGLKAKPMLDTSSAPYVVCVIQECTRMNTLLTEIRQTLIDLDKGLKGQLNMTQSMEDMMLAFTLNQFPGRNPFDACTWEKLAWPSKKSLFSQFADMLKRIGQLETWTEDLVTPFSVWVSGMFNPTAFMTAVKQVTARSQGSALDKMTTETHVTLMREASEADYFPDSGAFVHGLFIEGARWPSLDEVEEVEIVGSEPETKCGGVLTESKLKELLPAMPLLYVKAVPVDPAWLPEAVGYMRPFDESTYECPVYQTTLRGGSTYIFLATLNTKEPCGKWVLTATALMLQSDD